MAEDRRLHVAVDGRELTGRPTGVGRYVGEVLRAWATDSTWPHETTVFVPDQPPQALAAQLGTRVKWQVLPMRRGGTWWEQWQLPPALRKARADVLFAGAYTAPLFCPCPFVVVIHDVSFTAHPEWFSSREGARRRWLTRHTSRRAAAIISVSDFSAREIVRLLGVDRSRITLASPGAPPRAISSAEPPLPEHPRTDAPRPPVVLFVGSLFNRRLIPALIAGFAHAVRDVPAARLIIVGDNRTEPHVDPRRVATDLGVSASVEWKAYVNDDELARLYGEARVFAFLSTYEGFGMTPLEAIAHGVPAVLLDTEVTREIYGTGARLVDETPEAIGRALVTLMTDDRAHADQLSAGRALLDRYTWRRTAATIREVLERAAGSR